MSISVDTSSIRSDWAHATFREKYGEGLFSEEQKRINQYRDVDMNMVSGQALRLLDKVDTEKKTARSVSESFTPAAGLDLRLRAPLRV